VDKERYFTPENIESAALQMIAELGMREEHRASPFEPKRSALLVLDMQDYFLDPASHAFIPSAPAILPHICELTQAYIAHELPVIFSRHLNTDQNAGQMAVWWRDLLTADHPHSAITSQLDPASGILIEKSQYDAFFDTSLEEDLRTRHVEQVVVCGVMTHLCCESTARSAFVRGFEVFFLVDGTATYNQAFHRATLLNLSHGFATLMLTKDVLASLASIEDRSRA